MNRKTARINKTIDHGNQKPRFPKLNLETKREKYYFSVSQLNYSRWEVFKNSNYLFAVSSTIKGLFQVKNNLKWTVMRSQWKSIRHVIYIFYVWHKPVKVIVVIPCFTPKVQEHQTETKGQNDQSKTARLPLQNS